MTQRKRLAVARFWYEGNAFACSRPAARISSAANGSAARRAWTPRAAKATELAAVADFQDSRSDWEVRASRCASAQPAGPVPQPFFQAYVDEVLDDLRGQHWDAIYLSLHGACITDADDSPELSLLRAIRAEHPRVPIGASFDLHANIPPALPPLLSCSASYRTYPHIDMRETAARCLERLIAIAEGGIRPSPRSAMAARGCKAPTCAPTPGPWRICRRWRAPARSARCVTSRCMAAFLCQFTAQRRVGMGLGGHRRGGGAGAG